MALSFAHGTVQWLAADAATTVYTVSGLSFQPKALRFTVMGIQSSTDSVASPSNNTPRSVGFATSTSDRRAVASSSNNGVGTSDCSTGYRTDCVVISLASSGTVGGLLDLNSITSDGFTLIVDDQTPNGLSVQWEAWGGSDITVAVTGEIVEPAATGNVDYTVTGFSSTDSDDQVVMFAGCQATGAAQTVAAQDSGFCIGFASGGASGENIVVLGNSDTASAAMDTDGYCKTGECIAMIVVAGGNPNARAQLTQFGADNFRLNWIARGTTNRKYIFLAIKGGSWRAGSYTIDGSTGSATATVSGLPFAPVGLSLIGRLSIESTAGTSTTEDLMSAGVGSSTSSRRSLGYRDENATASSNVELDVTVQYDQVLSFPSNTATLLSAYDINAMNSDGFQIIVDTAGGVASEWQGYLTYGDAPAVTSVVKDLIMSGYIPFARN